MAEPEPTELLHITGLGADGDGIAATGAGALFVPRVLPGERVRRTADGTFELVAPGPERRAEPLCPHFPACGGCAVQHMGDTLYRRWKAGLLPEALRRAGLDAPIAPMIEAPLASRRRAVLAAEREGNAIRLGFHRTRSHDIEPMTACAILAPAIVAALGTLRQLALHLVPGKGVASFAVLATPAGLDVTVTGARPRLGVDVQQRVVAIARAARIPRLTVDGAPWLMSAAPALMLDGIAVTPPPGAFTQATAETERAMIGLSTAAIGKARRVADLFAGIGTFALAHSRLARVLAIDSDKTALAALGEAHRHAQGLKPIETRVRDLVRDPLSPVELADIDAVVIDPPRAGARAQAEALARSKVTTVVAVSCNPATLARDLAILVAGGYRIETVTPLDQFLFTPHLEAVAVLRRAKR